MKYKYPKFNLDKDQKIWLEKVYESFKNKKEYIEYRIIRAELWKKLSKDFEPSNIDNSLLLNLTTITPIGIYNLDPQREILKIINTIILSIRDILLKNPIPGIVASKDVSKKLSINEETVTHLMKYLINLGPFYNGYNQKDVNSIELNIPDKKTFDEYVNYKNLEYQCHKRFIKNSSEITSTSDKLSNINITRKEYKPNTAFILMWMDKKHPELDDVSNTIKEVCENYDIHAVRSDDIEHQDKITDVIIQNIKDSQFIIADLSGERPNVYYEVGYAHCLGKSPILFRKQGTKLHFDLSVHNVPEYKNLIELKGMLNKRFEAILGRVAGK